MTMPIQSEDLSRQFAVNVAAPMEKHQNFDQSTEELNKKSDVEKKKRPEDAVSSLAAIAALAWMRQPVEIKAHAELKTGIDMQAGSISKNSSVQPSSQSDSVESTEDRVLGLQSSLIDAYKSSAAQISRLSNGAKSVSADSIRSSVSNSDLPVFSSKSFSTGRQADHVQSVKPTRDLSLQILSPQPMVAPPQSASSSQLPGTQPDLSSENELQSVSAIQSKLDSAKPSSESQVQIDRGGDMTAEQPSSLSQRAQRLAGANTGSADSSDLMPKRARSEQDDESSNSAMVLTNQGPAPTSLYVAVQPPQQQFSGDSSKRAAEHANAAQSVQKALAPEGIRYSLETWGADKSVQITGTAQKGYVLHASDNEVQQILKKHEDESLPATIAAVSGASELNQDYLPIEAVGSADKSEA